MWLIDTTTMQLEAFDDPATVGYAILSHTWADEEVTFKDIQDLPKAREKAGFVKIAKVCDIALQRGLGYAWVDTCCIDKSSSAELSEAINSMFRWYQLSRVCIVSLGDLPATAAATNTPRSSPLPTPVHSPTSSSSPLPTTPVSSTPNDSSTPQDLSDLGLCRWFNRGWTLQELIAPPTVEFYDRDWHFRFTKEGTAPMLSSITGIDIEILRMTKPLDQIPIAARMSWAAHRHTRRVEDMAYCLLGIFDVNMPMVYGEGPKAFLRLQEHIASQTDDTSLFAWLSAGEQVYRGIYALSPSEFAHCAGIKPRRFSSTIEFQVTNTRVEFDVFTVADQRVNCVVVDLDCEQPECKACLETHPTHIALVPTAKGSVRFSSDKCVRGGFPTQNQKMIKARKVMSAGESKALEPFGQRPIKIDIYPAGYFTYCGCRPWPLWDTEDCRFFGEALAQDFTGTVYFESEEFLPFQLVLAMHKPLDGAMELELYAVGRRDEAGWQVAHDQSLTLFDDNSQPWVLLDRLCEIYRVEKQSGGYRPKNWVRVESRDEEKRGGPNGVFIFEASVKDLNITVVKKDAEYCQESLI